MSEEPHKIRSTRRPPARRPMAAQATPAPVALEPAPVVETLASTPEAQEQLGDFPQRIRDITPMVDNAWRRFRALAMSVPSERMDERLSEDGWTRKQMLAHIAAWHDLTHDRLGKLIISGKSADITESSDSINARVARQAVGRTAGEIVKEMEMTFNRLRRQLVRLTDQQLVADDGWAANIIAGNTYEHYNEHWADIAPPSSHAGAATRR
ncbi:MAG: DinB family protein [Candidatus Limnocylindrales bacterium]